MIFELYPQEVATLASYSPDERRISVFADSETGQERMQSIAIKAGASILFSGMISDGVERLADYPAGDVILVDIVADAGDSLDVFLDRLDALARFERVPIIVNSAIDVLDQVSARLYGPSIALMSQASAVDVIAALVLFGAVREPVLHDAVVDDSMRLQRLADEVQRIAQTLADLVGNEQPAPLRGVSDALIGFRADPGSCRAPTNGIGISDVRAIIRLRRMRDRFFRSDLFADPAWDMLLDLMAARLERVQVAVSSLCIAAAVPPTTALRWIKTMSENGLFVRVADPDDGRRVFIELSEDAASAMSAYLSAAKASGGLAI
jgi:hypothetical protein